ncbi:hypothetical protein DPMN_103651 [Dreissena polymorpha]|uniref:Uncharacterized protein n=1 Tax=Dreissena polymorpha TaxID=45954 RepID=A0A9D4H898_DREPO|nr:hypothetical protein DPMN_103630 [Dreissena polymorpha]KAH3830408.1 hypothetical protein DPMN_103651 [Dreissena polymorpha]
MWPIESWYVFDRSIRTNNDCEGWHHRLNRRAKKGNLPFYLLVQLLFEEAKMLCIWCERGSCKGTRQSRHSRYRGSCGESGNDRNISTSQLLDLCSSMYGPV